MNTGLTRKSRGLSTGQLEGADLRRILEPTRAGVRSARGEVGTLELVLPKLRDKGVDGIGWTILNAIASGLTRAALNLLRPGVLCWRRERVSVFLCTLQRCGRVYQ